MNKYGEQKKPEYDMLEEHNAWFSVPENQLWNTVMIVNFKHQQLHWKVAISQNRIVSNKKGNNI